MDAHNLAVVFGPTLLRIPSEQDMIAYQSQVNGMMELLIKHCAEVFPGSGEPLHARLSETEESDSEEGIACSNVVVEKKILKKLSEWTIVLSLALDWNLLTTVANTGNLLKCK